MPVIRVKQPILDRLDKHRVGGEPLNRTITRILDGLEASSKLPHQDAICRAFKDIYDTIAHDLSAPGACMDREDIFDICCDHMSNAGLLDDAFKYWKDLNYYERHRYLIHAFPEEYYEVGDNSGFGEDGTMT